MESGIGCGQLSKFRLQLSDSLLEAVQVFGQNGILLFKISRLLTQLPEFMVPSWYKEKGDKFITQFSMETWIMKKNA